MPINIVEELARQCAASAETPALSTYDTEFALNGERLVLDQRLVQDKIHEYMKGSVNQITSTLSKAKNTKRHPEVLNEIFKCRSTTGTQQVSNYRMHVEGDSVSFDLDLCRKSFGKSVLWKRVFLFCCSQDDFYHWMQGTEFEKFWVRAGRPIEQEHARMFRLARLLAIGSNQGLEDGFTHLFPEVSTEIARKTLDNACKLSPHR